MLFKDKIYTKYHKPLERESSKLLENMALVLRGHITKVMRNGQVLSQPSSPPACPPSEFQNT